MTEEMTKGRYTTRPEQTDLSIPEAADPHRSTPPNEPYSNLLYMLRFEALRQ